MAKLNFAKISENWWAVWFGNLSASLKYTDINFIKAILGNSTLPFKIEIKLVYTEGDVCKDTKNHELQN